MAINERRGRLAQLVERLLYTQDVGGSSPSPPTIEKSTAHVRFRGKAHIACCGANVCFDPKRNMVWRSVVETFPSGTPARARRLNNNENPHYLGRGLHHCIASGHGRRSAERSAKFLHERSISGLLASHPRPAERLSLPAR